MCFGVEATIAELRTETLPVQKNVLVRMHAWAWPFALLPFCSFGRRSTYGAKVRADETMLLPVPRAWQNGACTRALDNERLLSSPSRCCCLLPDAAAAAPLMHACLERD